MPLTTIPICSKIIILIVQLNKPHKLELHNHSFHIRRIATLLPSIQTAVRLLLGIVHSHPKKDRTLGIVTFDFDKNWEVGALLVFSELVIPPLKKMFHFAFALRIIFFYIYRYPLCPS